MVDQRHFLPLAAWCTPRRQAVWALGNPTLNINKLSSKRVHSKSDNVINVQPLMLIQGESGNWRSKCSRWLQLQIWIPPLLPWDRSCQVYSRGKSNTDDHASAKIMSHLNWYCHLYHNATGSFDYPPNHLPRVEFKNLDYQAFVAIAPSSVHWRFTSHYHCRSSFFY